MQKDCINIKGVRVFRSSDFSLSIPELSLEYGRITALMGASGVGKSTLLRALAGQVPLQSGEICFDLPSGRLQLPTQVAAVPKHVHYVGQGQSLLPYMTLKANILALSRIRNEQNKALGKIEAICGSLGISDILERYPDEISNGQYQRALLARSLILGPDIILIDEITSSLDRPTALNIISTLLSNENAKFSHVVLVTHFASLVRTFATDVAFLSSSGSIHLYPVVDFFSSDDAEIVAFRG